MRILAVTNIYPSAKAPGCGVFIEQQVKGLLAIGLDVQVLFIDRRQEGPWAYYQFGPRLRRALAEFGPDVVHVMYGGVMAERVVREKELPPVIITFHGSDLLGENFSGLARKIISRYGIYCSRKAARQAQGVIVVARHLLEALGGHLAPEKVKVIPCGIDLERFRPMEGLACKRCLGWDPEEAHVLFASSNADPVKRPELAQAAVDRLVGAGIRARLHLLSGVPNSEVPIWINASDALLLTSHHEGSPTIVKEALACGLPVVSVDVGDVAERIEGIAGCHLAEAEPEDLSSKLQQVFKGRSRLECRGRVQELSRGAVARKLESFYAEILGSSERATEAMPRTPCAASSSSS